MRLFKLSFKRLIILNSFIFSLPTLAEPWIDTSDIYLKAKIQLLADSGHIITPVTTYPLMWHDINHDLKKINTGKLTDAQQSAYYYINHKFRLASKNQTRIKTQVGSDDTRFTSFGDSYRDSNSVQIQSSAMMDNFATNISYSYYPDAEDKEKNIDERTRWDNSYLAAFWGNWVITLGKQDRWFGPTWDTSLSLSNNARPITAVSLTRKSAQAFIVPFTEFDIPWTVTTFMGKMDDDRTVKNTLLWGFRLNLKPFKNLELGVTRLAQWGGDGRPQDLDTFWNVLIGKDNCGAGGLVCDANNEPGNQQAGVDMRYSFTLLDTPLAVYGQYFAEDGDNSGGLGMVTKAQIQGGIDVQLNLFSFPTTAYLEYTDTYQSCPTFTGRKDIGDCYYEHKIYKTGMRFQGRTIGSLYDNDAETIVLGTISQLNTNTHMTTKWRYLDLNYDNNDWAPDNPIIGNPLTSIHEKTYMFSTTVQHNYKNWRFTLSTDISRSTFPDSANEVKNSTDINGSFSVEYNL